MLDYFNKFKGYLTLKDEPFSTLLNTSLKFTIYSLIILSVTRISVLLFLIDAQNYKLDELFPLFFTGFRFDIKIISTVLFIFVCLPAVLMIFVNRWRYFSVLVRLSLLIMMLIFLLLSCLDFGFYMYFGVPINVLVFGIIEDGTSEVVSSIFSDARLIYINLIFLILLYVFSLKFLRESKVLISSARLSASKLISVLLLITCSLVMLLLSRGSFDTFPLSRINANVSDNTLTNSLVLNAPYHLYYALKDRDMDSFKNISSKNILSQSSFTSSAELVQAAAYTEDAPLKVKSSIKAADFKPPHVIFVLMEGWSSHIAIMDSPDNNVLGSFAEHAKQDYFNTQFFSNGYGTNPSIDSLLMNSPITPLSQSIATGHTFEMSNALPFKRQEYDTLFLSGSNSAWRNHNNFWPKQGFDRYLGRATIESFYDIKSDNPWGVYEEYLFKYLQKTLTEAERSSTPLFSFVLTTNNHPPIRLPDNYVAPEFSMEKYYYAQDGASKHEILTGFHYQSNALGDFMSWLKQSSLKDDVIVVATGDHIYKGFANYTAIDMSYLRYSVPAYIYLPERYNALNKADQTIAGSHDDLFPTLFELALSGSEYFSFGTPLMHKNKNSAYGWISQGSFLFEDGVALKNNKFHAWQDDNKIYLQAQPKPLSSFQEGIIRQQKYRSLLKKYLLVKDLEGQVK